MHVQIMTIFGSSHIPVNQYMLQIISALTKRTSQYEAEFNPSSIRYPSEMSSEIQRMDLRVVTIEDALRALKVLAGLPCGALVEGDIISVLATVHKLLWDSPSAQEYLGNGGACDALVKILHTYKTVSALVSDSCMQVISTMCRCQDDKQFSNNSNIDKFGRETCIQGLYLQEYCRIYYFILNSNVADYYLRYCNGIWHCRRREHKYLQEYSRSRPQHDGEERCNQDRARGERGL